LTNYLTYLVSYLNLYLRV